MKKFLATIIFVFGAFALVSCGGSDSDGNGNGSGGNVYCQDSGDAKCQYKSCGASNGTGWYEYDGKKYECKGSGKDIDCVEAAQAVFQACGLF